MSMFHECMRNPQPPLEPPEEHYIMADCGHEVYEGENLYTWEGRYICPDCLREKVEEMTLPELAKLLGSEAHNSGFPRRRI